MNRLELEQLINDKIPSLKEELKDSEKQRKKLLQKFVRDFSPEKFELQSLDDYVIGLGAENKSFCYRIERELDGHGRITGSTADKFGIYYSKDDEQYLWTGIWGTPDDIKEGVLANIKASILDLMRPDITIAEAKKIRISPLFRGKILFLYHPDRFMNIYSKDHLKHYCSVLNIKAATEHELDLQDALLRYLRSFDIMKDGSWHIMSEFLYRYFEYKKDGDTFPSLSKAVKNVKYGKSGSGKKPNRKYKPDYEKLQRNRKIIGDRGEKIVFETEKERLKKWGRTDLADRVVHIAETEDGKGYDVLSFDVDGTERYIEVKATAMYDRQNGFYLTANELKRSKELKNYYLYYVYNALSEYPVIEEIENPDFENEFSMRPTLYKVTY